MMSGVIHMAPEIDAPCVILSVPVPPPAPAVMTGTGNAVVEEDLAIIGQLVGSASTTHSALLPAN